MVRKYVRTLERWNKSGVLGNLLHCLGLNIGYSVGDCP